MGILDELFRRKPDDEFLPEYAKPEMTLQEVLAAAQALTPSVPKSDKPADPLRWAADAIGQNKDLPAPEFFMDPRSLSMRNIVHSGLNTAANWLDGTKDPRAVQDQDMIAPLGLGGMGGIVNSMTRPGRDFRIADDLARQHPGAISGGDMQPGLISKAASMGAIKPASNPTDARYVADFGSMPSAPTRPQNDVIGRTPNTRGPQLVMADNAKGSAPGTIINSLDMSEAARMQRAREMGFDTERTWYHGTGSAFDEFDPAQIGKTFGADKEGFFFTNNPGDDMASGYAKRAAMENGGDGASVIPAHLRMTNPFTLDDYAMAYGYKDPRNVLDGRGLIGWFDPRKEDIMRLAKDGGHDGISITDMDTALISGAGKGQPESVAVAFDPSAIRSTQAAFDPSKRDSANLLAASPSASAPGLAANSTQPKDARELSEPMLMELLRRLEEGA